MCVAQDFKTKTNAVSIPEVFLNVILYSAVANASYEDLLLTAITAAITYITHWVHLVREGGGRRGEEGGEGGCRARKERKRGERGGGGREGCSERVESQ